MRVDVVPVLLATPGIGAGRLMDHRPGGANPDYNSVLYALGKFISGKSFDVFWRRKVFGREHIPPAGTPVIFAANHRSLADPNLVGSAVPYPIHYFAKEELFRIPVLGWYIRRVNAFPVRRAEHDIGAFKTALRVLAAGDGLLLFPEGGRRLDPRRQWVAKSGVGMLACKSGARVVPVAVTNSDRFTKMGAVTVRFGRVLFPPKEDTREYHRQFSVEVMSRIKELYG